MEKIVQVTLRSSTIISWYKSKGLDLKIGDAVILEVERGFDYGIVASECIEQKCLDNSVKSVVRLANPEDLKQIETNKAKANEAFNTCIEKLKEHKLDMKLVSAEYSFDRSKIMFYFTAEGRIDFRNLVKDLAKIFKTRIEMRQIGVRDEAKLFGGFGPCGRKLCCSSFLKDFRPVTIKMAKEQGLPLNPPKISGLCGRLMCCLSYEHECYRALAKNLPRIGDKVDTPQGKGKVIGVSVIRQVVLVEIEEGKQVEVSYKEKENK